VVNQNKLWKHYYDRVDGIIFVVDSTDQDRIEAVNSELANILLEPTLKEVPILVMCNKTDISTDTSVEKQLFEKLK
jgi:GTPase SAR1 family protein